MGGTKKHTNLGIGKFAQRAIENGFSNQEVLQKVLAAFPHAKTTIGCINWYRCDMRRQGHNVPTARDIGEARRVHRKAELENVLQMRAA